MCTSSIQEHSGNNSYTIDEDFDIIKYTFISNIQKVVEMWFYDDSSDKAMVAMGSADDGVTSVGIGVNASSTGSTTNYVYRTSNSSVYTVTKFPVQPVGTS